MATIAIKKAPKYDKFGTKEIINHKYIDFHYFWRDEINDMVKFDNI